MSTHPLPPRCIALAGPQGTGKTTLFESLLFTAGALGRKGRVADGTSVGDASPEARAHGTTSETTLATVTWHGEEWTVLDTPGSVELAHEARQSLLAADAVVVVCEPSVERAAALGPLLTFLDERRIPHVLFVNKARGMQVRIADLLAALQAESARPLVVREVPIRDGDRVTGVVDVVSERAWAFAGGTSTRLLTIPDSARVAEAELRTAMVERLAELDDALLAEFLDDVTPTPRELWENLERDFAADLVVPVFFGEALTDEGVDRLQKALRHEVPGPEVGAARLGVAGAPGAALAVFKTQHVAHTGKVSWARVWSGAVEDGQSLPAGRVSGLYTGFGARLNKIERADRGAVVALGKLDEVHTGDWLAPSPLDSAAPVRVPAPTPVYTRAIRTEKRGDDVKLPAAIARLVEEDASLVYLHDPDTGETTLRGQGPVHLAIVAERLRGRFGVGVTLHAPKVPYRETVRTSVREHGRHKRQSGGHGQFADVVLEVCGQSRGAGFAFLDRVVGGAVPRQFIPAVEHGAREALGRGPLGFPVIDVSVALLDGGFHAVDSSDQAFQIAASQTVREALAKAEPVLLEPILRVEVRVPRAFTPSAQRLVTGRRGQLLGFVPLDGKDGWDVVTGQVPQAELAEFIVDLRSQSLGLGEFDAAFEQYKELVGRIAEQVVAAAKES